MIIKPLKLKIMNKEKFNEVFEKKVGYDSENKKFLIRVYPSLINVINNNPKPKWVEVMKLMLGDNPKNCNPASYYSSIRRCLKEIDVCTYDKSVGHFVKGSNWDRFVSNENWNWFVCKTGSCERSFVKK
jgi:hypothetical protein